MVHCGRGAGAPYNNRNVFGVRDGMTAVSDVYDVVTVNDANVGY